MATFRPSIAVLTDEYELVDDIAQADAVLVRSADMHDGASRRT